MKRLKLLALLICAIVVATGVSYYLLIPREGKRPQPPPPEKPTPKQQIIRVELNATAQLDELPFEVHWSARVSGGNPPYKIESPIGMMVLMSTGEVSGIQLFNTNKNPWKVAIRVKDSQGGNATAQAVVDNRVLAGSTLLFNGPRLANDSIEFFWEQVYNPDCYDGWDYVTGNEAEVSSPSSPRPTVKFQWPGLYRFSLRAVKLDGTETFHTVDVLVSLADSPFKLRGAALPVFEEARCVECNLDRIRAWEGNLVAYHFNLYAPHPNASVIVPSWELPQIQGYRFTTPKDEQLKSWIRMAHDRELNVLVVPHVVCIEDSMYFEAWEMKPENITDWFRHYKELMLHYALIAEEERVEIFSLGADLGPHQYVPNVWREMISEVRKIYSGNVTVTEAPGWGYWYNPEPPDFVQDIDLMDFDFNYRGSEDQFHPRTSDMAKRFSGFIRREHGWMAVPYMKRYGKPWLVNCFGLPNGDGVNRYLHLRLRPEGEPLRIDNQEQVDYVEAGFRALSELIRTEVGDLLLGVIIYSLDDWPVPPDEVSWSVAGRPVEDAIRLWFCGQGQLRPVYIPPSAIRRGDTLLEDDFEDRCMTFCAGWWQRGFPPGWELLEEDGNHFVRATYHQRFHSTSTWEGRPWTDYRVTIRVRLMSRGEALLTLRVQNLTYEAYVLVFGTNGVMLLRDLGGGQVKLLAKANWLETVELGTWYNLEVALIDSRIDVCIDNKQLFGYNDVEEPLLKGGVALDIYNPKGTGEEVNRAIVDFDDVLITAE